MRIGIFTYHKAHRKTQDLVYRLKLKGCDDITLIISPWVDRPQHKPIFEHRPLNPLIGFDNFVLSMRLKTTESPDGFDKILIGGANLIEDKYLKYKIINAHPGYLPFVRGLDALKWAILEGLPIGVTTHYIDKEPDAGWLIDQRLIDVNANDTFHSISWRLYELEIEMLANAVTEPATRERLRIDYPVRKRMSHFDELRMINHLNSLINSK